MGFWEIKEVKGEVKIYSASRSRWTDMRLNMALRKDDIIVAYSGSKAIIEESKWHTITVQERTAYQVGGKSISFGSLYMKYVTRKSNRLCFESDRHLSKSSRLDIIKKHFIKKNNFGYFRRLPAAKKQIEPEESTQIPEVNSGQTSYELDKPSYAITKMTCTYCLEPPRSNNFYICENHGAPDKVVGGENSGVLIYNPMYGSLDEAAMTAAKIILHHMGNNYKTEFGIAIYSKVDTNGAEKFFLTTTKRGDPTQVHTDDAITDAVNTGYSFRGDVHCHPMSGVQEFSGADYILACGGRF